MNDVQALASFPPPVATLASEVAAAVAESSATTCLIVLDDDPTGTQSIADLPVLTRWEESDFDWALFQGSPAIYVLTNTRSVDPQLATERNREIVTNAVAAASRAGITLSFVSRGDSTLRGHYPLETDVIAATLAETTGEIIDAVVIVPAFPDAGRVTIGGVHYMRSGDTLTPIADTEFARDATFGYRSSGLAEWVQEKSGGERAASDVIVLDLGVIRAGADAIADAIEPATDSRPIVADAVSEDDLRLLSLGLIEAERRGKSILHRVGPPFVRARIGQNVREPLRADEVFSDEVTDHTRGGLIVVGSHVGLTTRQLDRLVAARPDAARLELDVETILDAAASPSYLVDVSAQLSALLESGDVIVNTSRLLRKTDDPDESLDISRRVSSAVVEVVQRTIAVRLPRFVIAKGGITSSDVAAHGLGIRHAIVRGPMLPGLVSLWEPVDGPALGVPFIVFAGNVGTDESLADVVATLTASAL